MKVCKISILIVFIVSIVISTPTVSMAKVHENTCTKGEALLIEESYIKSQYPGIMQEKSAVPPFPAGIDPKILLPGNPHIDPYMLIPGNAKIDPHFLVDLR